MSRLLVFDSKPYCQCVISKNAIHAKKAGYIFSETISEPHIERWIVQTEHIRTKRCLRTEGIIYPKTGLRCKYPVPQFHVRADSFANLRDELITFEGVIQAKLNTVSARLREN